MFHYDAMTQARTDEENAMRQFNDAMRPVTRTRWVVDVDTFYSDGDHHKAIVSEHATKAEAMAELRRIVAIHKASQDTVKIIRFDAVNVGIKGKYSNLIIDIHVEAITKPAFAW